MILIIYSIVVTLLLIGVCIVAYRYGRTLLNIEDNIDTCLFFIQKRYSNILEKFYKSELLVMSNEIKNFINELKQINDDVRLIFSALSTPSVNFKAEIGLSDIQTTQQDENTNPAIDVLKEYKSGDKKKEDQAKEDD